MDPYELKVFNGIVGEGSSDLKPAGQQLPIVNRCQLLRSRLTVLLLHDLLLLLVMSRLLIIGVTCGGSLHVEVSDASQVALSTRQLE